MSMRRAYLTATRHLRYFSEKRADNPWEITHKQWRRPPLQNASDDSLKVKLGLPLNAVKFLHKLDPQGLVQRPQSLKLRSTDIDDEETFEEIFSEEKGVRGNSVTAAQYLLFNGGAVRFSAYPGWIKPNDDSFDQVPQISESANYLEAIYLSDLPIGYGVLKVLKHLTKVSSLTVKDCPNFDDWCLDHITGSFPGLEVLEIRNCKSVTGKGLATISRLTMLRTLNLYGFDSNPELELACLLLEEHFQNLNIEGITYSVDKAI